MGNIEQEPIGNIQGVSEKQAALPLQLTKNGGK
jgi:hypothetical protein